MHFPWLKAFDHALGMVSIATALSASRLPFRCHGALTLSKYSPSHWELHSYRQSEKLRSWPFIRRLHCRLGASLQYETPRIVAQRARFETHMSSRSTFSAHYRFFFHLIIRFILLDEKRKHLDIKSHQSKYRSKFQIKYVIFWPLPFGTLCAEKYVIRAFCCLFCAENFLLALLIVKSKQNPYRLGC